MDIGVYKSTELYPSSLFSVAKQLGVDWISSTQLVYVADTWDANDQTITPKFNAVVTRRLEKSVIMLLGLHPWYTTNKYVTYLDVIYCYPTLNYMIWSFLKPWAKLITLPTSPSFPQLPPAPPAPREEQRHPEKSFRGPGGCEFAKGWPQNAGEKCDMSWGYHGDIMNNHDYI